MSAYRALSSADLDSVRRLAAADALEDVTPITAGIENSNWFVTLVRGSTRFRCVLTLVEAVPADELPYFIALTDGLAEADLPVPMALVLDARQRQFDLQGKPALLVPRMPGTHIEAATPALCAAAGDMLARIHRHGTSCAFRRERPDHRWWPTAFASIAPLLPRDVHDELGKALLDASALFANTHGLPHGVIHGDLFRDNVLVDGDEITAVLDFFHATTDLLSWDIAIALNDWAVVDGEPDTTREAAFLAGYARQRVLVAAERDLLPGLRVAAAARFWLSRCIAALREPGVSVSGASLLWESTAVQRKDPEAMRALWRRLRAEAGAA